MAPWWYAQALGACQRAAAASRSPSCLPPPPPPASPPQVAAYTLRMLRRRVPPAVPGIMFLSGGWAWAGLGRAHTQL